MMPHIARKRFGQHFLVDRQVIADIVDLVAVQRSDLVVEIGPGLGALTDPPVSYTHLDVYKRQRMRGACCASTTRTT